ncbi:hypothetical protein ABZ860_36165 [Microbispora sp. NPDC046973]|uniref:hypothetical protein n=1 Tax=Microbispora sp. NPDC046973 TaxID=3155022 RepID=UPI0033DDA251
MKSALELIPAMPCRDTAVLSTSQSLRDAMHVVLRLSGPVDLDTLHLTLATFLERHEILWEEDDLRYSMLDLSSEPRDPAAADAVVSTVVAEESLTEFRPAFRCWLVRVAPDDHVLSLLVSREIADQATAAALFHELPGIYAALAGGRPLPPTTFTRGRPPAETHPRVNRRFTLSAGTTRGLYALAVRRGTDVTALVRAAFAAVYGREAGLDRVVLGVPAPGRPMVADLPGDPLSPVLTTADEDEPGAYQVMVESLLGEESRYGGGRWDGDLHATVAYADAVPADLHAALVLRGDGDRLAGVLHCRADRFQAGAVELMARRLVALLDALAGDMYAPITPPSMDLQAGKWCTN